MPDHVLPCHKNIRLFTQTRIHLSGVYIENFLTNYLLCERILTIGPLQLRKLLSKLKQLTFFASQCSSSNSNSN